ncbi:MAG: hypothetical protein ACK44E_10475, partial [Anaerolineales bacterium]
MKKTKNQISIPVRELLLANPAVWRQWFYIFLAVGLALGGWFWLSRLAQVGASPINNTQINGGQTHIWPTEVINSPMASGREFFEMTGRSLAYYTDKNHTVQQLHVAYGGKNLYYSSSTWGGSSWNSWSAPVIVDSNPDVGKWASIAVDSFNRPHIAYYDKANGCLKYATKNVVWTVQTVDCDNALLPLFEENGVLSEDEGDEQEVFIEPTIVQLSETSGFPLRQAGQTTQSENGSLAEPSSGSGKYTSIAIDSYGRPHISYAKFYPRSDRTYHKLKYAYFDGSVW